MPTVDNPAPKGGVLRIKLETKMGTAKPLIRPGTSDLNVLKEVLIARVYRKATINFDVEAGESWLDLGANIGAFTLYCHLNDASCMAFEPEPRCFELLQMNVGNFPECEIHCAAVTSSTQKFLQLYPSNRTGNHSRSTFHPTRIGLKDFPTKVANRCINTLEGFDGIKMDIEGSEFGIMDSGLIPKCNKLVMEYHSSRDPSCANLKRRLQILKDCFKVVSYPAELDRLAQLKGNQKPFCDRMIHCKGWKGG
jgi:FkbM family methyltransferase